MSTITTIQATDIISASRSVINTNFSNLNTDLVAVVASDALKAPSASPTFTGTVVLPSTTSVGNVTDTELGYLDGVTSAIQTQLNAKATVITGSKATTFTFNGSGGTSGSVTLVMQRIGDFVTLYIPPVTATTGTNSNQFISNTAIDASFRPATMGAVSANNGVANNNADIASAGTVVVSAAGIVTLFRDNAGTNFTNTATAGNLDSPFTITYYVGSGS